MLNDKFGLHFLEGPTLPLGSVSSQPTAQNKIRTEEE